MNFEVHVDKKDLAAFRRRVAYHYRRRPKSEYMEAVFIRRDGNHFHIVKFQRLWIEKRNRYEVESSDIQFKELKNQAASQGLHIGTIHTHTISDSAPSRADILGGVEDNEALLGVCEVDEDKNGRLKMHIDFWLPQLPGKIHQICK